MNPELNQYETKVIATEDMFKVIKQYLKAEKIKPLSRKQLQWMVSLMDHREARARLQGYTDGVAKEKTKLEHGKTVNQTRAQTLDQLNKLMEHSSNILQAAYRILNEAR